MDAARRFGRLGWTPWPSSERRLSGAYTEIIRLTCRTTLRCTLTGCLRTPEYCRDKTLAFVRLLGGTVEYDCLARIGASLSPEQIKEPPCNSKTKSRSSPVRPAASAKRSP